MSREQFEKFAIAEFGAINLLRWPETGKYQVDLYEFAWQGFQSGHAAGLEDAAKIADSRSGGPCGEFDYGYTDADFKADTRASDIADEIRAAIKEPK